jgi:hypothetical protein
MLRLQSDVAARPAVERAGPRHVRAGLHPLIDGHLNVRIHAYFRKTDIAGSASPHALPKGKRA